jgi:hypothetical protein
VNLKKGTASCLAGNLSSLFGDLTNGVASGCLDAYMVMTLHLRVTGRYVVMTLHLRVTGTYMVMTLN